MKNLNICRWNTTKYPFLRSFLPSLVLSLFLFLKYLTPEPDREKVHEDYLHGEAYVVFIYGQDLSRQEKLIL